MITIFLLTLGAIAIALTATGVEIGSSIDYANYGFGFINLVTPLYLQGQSSKRKGQILDLEYLQAQVMEDPDFDSTLLKKILEKL